MRYGSMRVNRKNKTSLERLTGVSIKTRRAQRGFFLWPVSYLFLLASLAMIDITHFIEHVAAVSIF